MDCRSAGFQNGLWFFKICRLGHGSMNKRSQCAFLRSEVSVAGACCKPISLSHGGKRLDGDGKIQVAPHAANDGELLPVFLSENGMCGLRHKKKFGHNCANSIEMACSAASAECRRKLRLTHCHAGIGCIHLTGAWKKNGIRSRSLACSEIL